MDKQTIEIRKPDSPSAERALDVMVSSNQTSKSTGQTIISAAVPHISTKAIDWAVTIDRTVTSDYMIPIHPVRQSVVFDRDGVARIAGTRIALDTVVRAFQNGDTPNDITRGFPTLSLSDVMLAIAYYLDNQEYFDKRYFPTREREASSIREELEEKYSQHGIRDRLIQRRNSGG